MSKREGKQITVSCWFRLLELSSVDVCVRLSINDWTFLFVVSVEILDESIFSGSSGGDEDCLHVILKLQRPDYMYIFGCWLINHVIYLKLRVDIGPEYLCVKYFLSFPQKTCHQRKLWQTKSLLFNFWIIKLTKRQILPNCHVPNGFFLV